MPGKTKKDLQTENSVLKEELLELRTKLSERCECEKQSKKEQLQNNKSFKCYMCDVAFVSQEDFKKHKDDHKINKEMYHCDECEKVFNEEWKLNAHKKRHKNFNFKCNQCSKTFKTEDIMEKHVRISHENIQIYCHFFNNDKTCPYENECIFLHDVAGLCRYGVLCERNYCMYKHDDEKCERELVNDEDETVNVFEPDECEEFSNKTFQNPSQFDKILSDEKFQYDWCDFISERKGNLKKHQEKSRIWCCFCSDSGM